MPPEPRSRIRESHPRSLDLPPPFRLLTLREVDDAFTYACTHAAELGAGTLVLVGRFDLAEFAVILEPEEPLASARRAFYAGMVALSDALAALAPPEKPMTLAWPDAIHIDGGLVGGGRLGWPRRADEHALPDWLVFAATIRTFWGSGEEAGRHPLATALDEEGFGDLAATRLIEGFARHLMVVLDHWQEAGFVAVARAYMARLQPEGGARPEVTGDGDLAVPRAGKPVERRRLISALEMPSWLDPATGEPRR